MRRVSLLVSVLAFAACAKGAENVPDIQTDSSVADVVGIETEGVDSSTDAGRDATVAETASDAADAVGLDTARETASDTADSSAPDTQPVDTGTDAYEAGPDTYDAGPDTFDAGPWVHTINVDGVKDFHEGTEKFLTTTTGFSAWITWDANNLYVAYEGIDVGSNLSAEKWLLIYIDVDPGGGTGTNTAEQYRTQKPLFPSNFYADHYVRWRTDDLLLGVRSWTGTAWGTGVATGVTRAKTGGYIEFKIPRTTLFPASSSIGIMTYFLNEKDFGEFTWAGLYAGNFTDGYYNTSSNPLQISKYLLADFNLQLPPNDVSRKKP